MRSYRQFCSVSRALDALGDRWALLLLRELLFGPRRYTDLLVGLQGIGSSVLATRLRDLEEANLITSRELPPPAASTVYELTDDGAALRPVLDALARWGLRLMDRPRKGEALRGSWLAYSVAVSVPAAILPDRAQLEVRIDGEPHTFYVKDGRLQNRLADATDPVAVIQTSIGHLYLVAAGQADARELETRGELVISGDRRVARRFLEAAHGAWLDARG
jgi:DNA-binding HxlR family transcriptional regulator